MYKAVIEVVKIAKEKIKILSLIGKIREIRAELGDGKTINLVVDFNDKTNVIDLFIPTKFNKKVYVGQKLELVFDLKKEF